MSTLMDRAKGLIAGMKSGNRAMLGALVIVPLAATAQQAYGAAPVPYSLTSGSAFFFRSSGGSVTDGTATLGAVAGAPLRLNTSAPITVSSSTYSSDAANSYDLKWTGTLNASSFPVNTSQVGVAYAFNIGMTGTTPGSASWSLRTNIGGIELDASSSSNITGASNPISGSLSAPVTSTLSGAWTSELDITWSGFNSAQLTVDVPSTSSVDLSVSAVPEPASLGLLGLGAAALLARRRRM